MLALLGNFGLIGAGEYGTTNALATIDARITRVEARLTACDPHALQPRSPEQWQRSEATP